MTRVPDRLRERLAAVVDELGDGSRVVSITPLGGGCINNGARVETDRGASYFLKWNERAPSGMFAAETDGLRALAGGRRTVEDDAGVRVPRVLAWDDRSKGPAWLLLEHIEPGPSSRGTDERLGHGLAEIHAWSGTSPARGGADGEARGAAQGEAKGAAQGEARAAARGAAGRPMGGEARRFGWARDNWIGSLPQENAPCGSWATFWRDRRIAPQLTMARERGFLPSPALDEILSVMPIALAGVNRPELLHGDLWGGNTYVDTEGIPVLIDPAVYLGDGEVDLAMTELFGGFGDRFYAAYRDRRPISAEYAAYRRDLYQLYYLLVHVNLFGRAYEAGARRAAEAVLAELR